MGRESRLLIDDYPLIILPELAVAIGLNEAIVLQQIHYWVENYRREGDKNHFRDGRYWIYNSLPDWQEQFPFWAESTIKRAIASLRKPHEAKDPSSRVSRGPLISVTHKYNRAGFDRTNWYTINYEELSLVATKVTGGLNRRSGQNDPTIRSKRPDGPGQNEPMEQAILTRPIPETTTETTTETSRRVVVPESVICSIHNTPMKKRTNDQGDLWYSHKVGRQWCQGAPGDQWEPLEDDVDDRRRYISGKYSHLIQY